MGPQNSSFLLQAQGGSDLDPESGWQARTLVRKAGLLAGVNSVV